jgi:hypothetical protein
MNKYGWDRNALLNKEQMFPEIEGLYNRNGDNRAGGQIRELHVYEGTRSRRAKQRRNKPCGDNGSLV